MAMILDWNIRSLPDYLRLKKEQQVVDQQEPGSKKKHKYLVPEKPQVCPDCAAKESFWVKSYFFRWAVEEELEEVLPVPRYICNCCHLVVSVIFAFLVPYRQFTVAIVGAAIQNYLLDRTTYREAAAEVAGDKNDVQRPNHSQVWHWVDLLAGRAANDLNVRLQRACVKAGRQSNLSGLHESTCPNAVNAHRVEKVRQLNCGTRLLMLAEVLLQRRARVVEGLQTYFLNFVQPAFSILTGREVRIFTPQSSQQVIW